MISNSGTIYSHHDKNYDKQITGFKYQYNDIITIEINPDSN